MTWWPIKGRPRQFIVICENSLCSTVFHLLVPGGRWQTVTCRAALAANFANSIFQARTRDPLEPPPSAQINNRSALGYRPFADGVPPAAERLNSERGGVMVGADRHPSGVRGHVVDAVRDRFSEFLVRKVVHVHRFR